MAKAVYWTTTDAETRKRGEQTGWSTAARLKLKGIDGSPHKQWSMWFNSTQREEPYRSLTSPEFGCNDRSALRRAGRQVVHGCRQLVS